MIAQFYWNIASGIALELWYCIANFGNLNLKMLHFACLHFHGFVEVPPFIFLIVICM